MHRRWSAGSDACTEGAHRTAALLEAVLMDNVDIAPLLACV
jgi:hypothetical protein